MTSAEAKVAESASGEPHLPSAGREVYGYSLVQTARLLCTLRWLCGCLSEMFGSWATQAADETGVAGLAAADSSEGVFSLDSRDAVSDDPDDSDVAAAAAVVELMRLSRRLADHRKVLDGLQPDSEKLATWREAAPANPKLCAALKEISVADDSASSVSQRVAIAQCLIMPMLCTIYERIGEQAAWHSDGALITTAETLGAQLSRLPHVLVSDYAEAQQFRHVSAEAAKALAAAGGLIPSEVLCPQDWP